MTLCASEGSPSGLGMWQPAGRGGRYSKMLHFQVKVKVAQSCLTLCNPMDYTVHGILQARILEWVAFPFSRGSSQPRDWTGSPTLQANSLPAEPPGKPLPGGSVQTQGTPRSRAVPSLLPAPEVSPQTPGHPHRPEQQEGTPSILDLQPQETGSRFVERNAATAGPLIKDQSG